MAEVLIGPVIGAVTHDSARVLLETDVEVKVVGVLAPWAESKDAAEVRVELTLRARHPTIFMFLQLTPGTQYSLSFEGIASPEKSCGSIRTLQTDAASLSVAACSCDRTGRRGDPDLWGKLLQMVRAGDVDLCVRLGDQVYADDAFDEGVEIMKKTALSADQKHEEIVEAYSNWYRKTWMLEPVREILASCPQYMLWDDHEIRNDWGTFPQDTDPQSIDFQVALGARDAYWRYQRQLWDDVDLARIREPISEGRMHTLCDGKFALVFVDTRASRSFCHQKETDEGMYIGTKQFEQLESYLKPGGALEDTQALVMIHSMPCVFTSTRVANCLSCIGPMKDKMGLGLNPEEQARYLSLVTAWRTQKDKTRDVLVLGGDLHYCLETDVYDANGEFAVRQLITSAIGNRPPPATLAQSLRFCCLWDCCNALGSGFTFQHTSKYYARNFALLSLRSPAISYRVIKQSDMKT